MRMYSHTPKSSVSFYNLIESIKNMIDHIFVFIQKNGGWLIIALMLVSVFATCLKKKVKMINIQTKRIELLKQKTNVFLAAFADRA